MALVVCNDGEQILLEWIFKSSGTNVVLKLFTNDYTPVASSAAGDFTEATFTGYSGETLARASFNDATTDGNGKAQITYADLTWTLDANPATVYGYYVTDAGGNLLFAERFAQARSLGVGDSLVLSPKFTLSSEA